MGLKRVGEEMQSIFFVERDSYAIALPPRLASGERWRGSNSMGLILEARRSNSFSFIQSP